MTDTPARRLGSSYVLTERVGAGAQGEVWRGHHVDSTEPLAFKVLRADLVDDPAVVERFIKERSTLLRVRSPYVVAIRDVVIEGSTFAIVMDYVDGGDLSGLLRTEGPLPPARLAALGSRIARGLAAVHHAGVVHRDVKPANILLSAASPGHDGVAPAPRGTPAGGGQGAVVPRVGDFGVARICDTLTAAQATGAIGTPLYMAPEILSPQAPTPAADVYSLGVMLYVMACAMPPFLGEPAQLLHQHARRDPGRPDGVPDPLWELMAAMLAKHPQDRPDADVVARSLEAMETALAGLPAAPRLPAPPPSAPSALPYDWDCPGALAPGTAGAGPAGSGPPARPGPAGGSPGGTAPAPGAPTALRAQAGPTLVTPQDRTSPMADAQAGYGIVPAPAEGPTRAYGTGDGPVTGWHGAPAPGPGGSPASPRPPGGPRRGEPRRRRRWVGVTVVLVVLALAAAGAGAWWWGSSTRDYPGWLAALPVGNSAREDQRLADVSEAALAPGGGMLAARSSGTWSLYDLTSSDKAPVWSGDCYKAAFWNARTLLCQQSSSSRSVLVGTGGTAAVPGPKDTVYVGATQDYAVVVDKARNRSNGDLIALDAQGKEVWRAAGAYSKGMVRNGFVLTYEDNSDSVQVLSAATGEVLVSALDKEPDFDPEDRAWPGGFNIGTGTAAFSRVTSEGATVYNASGSQVRSVPGTFRNPPTWASSAPLDAEGLAQAYTAAAKNPSALQAIGPDRVVDVTVDTSTCTASAGGTQLALPRRGSQEVCLLRPLGTLGEDLLMQVGQPDSASDAAGDRVVAYSTATGRPVWEVRGTYTGVVAAPGQPSQVRLLVTQGGSYGDLVVYTVLRR